MGKKNNLPWQRKTLAEKINDKLSVLRNLVIKDLPAQQPYCITISNPTKEEVKDFDVIGAYTYAGNVGWNSGSLTINGTTISSGISGVSYQQFMYASMFTPFKVGRTLLEIISGNSEQIAQYFIVTTQDAKGNMATGTLVPTAPTDSVDATIFTVNELYGIDGFTKLTFRKIFPETTFKIWMYPTIEVVKIKFWKAIWQCISLAGMVIWYSIFKPKK